MPKINKCSPEIPNIVGYLYRSQLGLSILFLGLGACIVQAADSLPQGLSTYQKVTGDDADEDRSRWDTLFKTRTYVYGKEPAGFLLENLPLFHVGRALDIAMGEGRNAVFLAKKGFMAVGVDISQEAIRKAKLLAKEQGVKIETVNADLNHYSIQPETYDLIINIQYLNRPLIAQIKRGLKKGGYVVFENHTLQQLKNMKNQSLSRDFLLKPGELRELFRDFDIKVYRETDDGKEATASLVARKR